MVDLRRELIFILVLALAGGTLYWLIHRGKPRAVTVAPEPPHETKNIIAEQIVTRDMSRGVVVRPGVTDDQPELIVDPFPEERTNPEMDPAVSGPVTGAEIAPVGGWEKSNENEFRVERDGSIANWQSLSKYLHGTQHSELSNPPTFFISAGGPAKMSVKIATVNDWAGARLEFIVDGKSAKSVPLPTAKDGTPLDKILEIEIPRGQHRIAVLNTGKDWACVGWYKFSGQLTE
jgi:hypothetical protein